MLDGRSFSSGNVAFRVLSQMMEKAATVSTSICSGLPSMVRDAVIGVADLAATIYNSSSLSPLSSCETNFCKARFRFSAPRGPSLLEQQTVAIWPFFPQWLQVVSIKWHLVASWFLRSQRKQGFCQALSWHRSILAVRFFCAGASAPLKVFAFFSANSKHWASSMALARVKFCSSSSFFQAPSLCIPHTRRSRSASSRNVPKSQDAARR